MRNCWIASSPSHEEVIFEAILQRHGPMVWGVCRRVLRDDHDVEDAFQATLLVFVRNAASVMPREKLGTGSTGWRIRRP